MTPAERQRRYRMHVKGDHSLCDAMRSCRTGVVFPDDSSPIPARLTRGQQLIEDMKRGLDPSQLVILHEAGRIIDRLDRLDAILVGTAGEWLRFHTSQSGDEVTVIVNSVLSEARQQALALKQLLAELRSATAPAKAPPVPGDSGGDQRGVTSIAARIAARRSQTPS